MNYRMRLFLAIAVLTLLSNFRASAAAEVTPVRTFEIVGDLRDDDGQVAKDISGIACAPPASDGKAKCLVINDQDKAAQALTLEREHLSVGEKVQLIGDAAAANIVGTAPSKVGCSGGEGKFKDLDGEGVAFAEPFFYIVGSHGCSRKTKKLHLSAFILARIAANKIGTPGTEKHSNLAGVATTFRLSEVLGSVTDITPQFGRDLQDDKGVANGLNIEGIAIDGSTLYVGLRAPSLGGRAFVIATPVEDLFSTAVPPHQLKVTSIPLDLGEHVGIRDLALVRPGLLLVLSGPAQEQTGIPYALATLDLATRELTARMPLAPVFENNQQGKAEALLPLAADANEARVVVLFDSLLNGGAREYAVPLR